MEINGFQATFSSIPASDCLRVRISLIIFIVDGMRKTLAAVLCLAFGFSSSGCRKHQGRPQNVPASATLVDGTFIDCTVDEAINKNRCTVYKASSGEILADGLFVVGYPPRAANKTELRYAGFRTVYLERSIALLDSQLLSFQEASENDPTNRLINDRLKSLSSSNQGPAINCGKTVLNKPASEVSDCARTAFKSGKPFYVRYSRSSQISYFSYGLAGDGEGDLFEVVYDLRGLLNFGLRKNAQVFDGNHIRVTACLKPVVLGKTEDGIPVCIQPINEMESAKAAQQSPIDTTLCTVTENPFLYNNKMVRVHGQVSVSAEYSELTEEGCSDSIWFTYGNGAATPGLVAYVGGGSEPGAQDSEGKRILPIPVKLVKNANFNRFQNLIRAQVRADARAEKTDPNEYVFHRVTATFVGRIDGASPDIHAFHLKRTQMDRADFLGFGQMGLFDAQFVLQSVEGDAVLSASSPIPRSQ